MEQSSLAKLSRPRLYDAVPREHLFERLDNLRQHPCVWVCGPPGSGKTTLVEAWLQSRDLKGIWYQVDRGDADLSTFFYYLAEAARPLTRRKGTLQLLTPEYLSDLPGYARRFFRDLFVRIPPGGVWVLDDHHESLDSTPFQQMLALAIREVPPGTNLIVLSRSNPPGVFVQHEANRSVVCLDPDELRLTPEEARLIAAKSGAGDADTARTLHERSGGWAAGLVLMLQRHRRGLAADELEAQSLNAVFEYFATQFFAEATEEVRLALMKASLVSSVTVEVAKGLTGNEQIERILTALCTQQFFTYRKGVDPVRFVFHDLFREFLARQARQHLPAAEHNRVRVVAADLLQRSGQAEEAFSLFSAAGDWEAALRVAIQAAARLMAQGRWRTLEDWIQGIPAATRGSNPWAHYWLGLARIPRDQTLAERELTQAHGLFEQSGDRIGQVLAASAIAESRYFSMSSWAPMFPWLELLDTMLAADDSWLPDPLKAQVYPPITAGLTMAIPSHPRLDVYIERAANALAYASSDTQRALGLALTLNICSVRGQHALASAIIERQGVTAELPDASPIANATLRTQLGFHCAVTGRLEAAMDHCTAALSIGREHGFEPLLQLPLLYMFIAEAARHNYPALGHLLSRMQSLLIPDRQIDVATVRILELWYDAATGTAAVTPERLQAVRRAVYTTGADLYIFIFHVILGAISVEVGELEQARQCLGVAIQTQTKGGLAGYNAMFEFAACRVQHAEGNVEAALDLLTSALASVHANPSHAAFLSWFAPPTMGKLMLFAIEQGLPSREISLLIQRLDIAPPPGATAAWPWPVRIQCLGAFRIESNGAPIAFGRKTPRKTLAFLKSLIAHGGRDVPLTRIADDIWSDEDGDAALEAAKVTLHRLRKIFGIAEALKLENGRLSLDARRVWVDSIAFEQAADGTAAALYRGVFLPGDEDEAWTFSARERLRLRYCREIISESARSAQTHQAPELGDLISRATKIDPAGSDLFKALQAALMDTTRSRDADILLRDLQRQARP